MRDCPSNGKVKFEQITSDKTNTNWDTIISKDEGNQTIHSTRKRSTIDHRSVFSSSTLRARSVYWWKKSGKEEVNNKTIAEEVILSPGLWSKILKKKSAAKSFKSLVFEMLKKKSKETNDGTGGYEYRIEIRRDTATTNTPYGNREIRSTKDSDLETIEKPFTATTISMDFTDYTTKTIKVKPLHQKEVTSLTKKPELKIVKTTEHVEIKTNYGDDENFEKIMNEDLSRFFLIKISHPSYLSKLRTFCINLLDVSKNLDILLEILRNTYLSN